MIIPLFASSSCYAGKHVSVCFIINLLERGLTILVSLHTGFFETIVKKMSPEEVKQVVTDSYTGNATCSEHIYDFAKGAGFELAMGGEASVDLNLLWFLNPFRCHRRQILGFW